MGKWVKQLRNSTGITEKCHVLVSKCAATAHDPTEQSTPQAGPSQIPVLPNLSSPYSGNTPYTGMFPFPGPATGPSSSRFPYFQAPHPPILEISNFCQYYSDLTPFPHYTSNPHFPAKGRYPYNSTNSPSFDTAHRLNS
ncbi:hypothetical protein PAXRUDRAFT_832060 [Paxillus rubicundulus Ve08.2h10]|uniref:Uncharacterized protein n=1 Tax=Paxillus rubicundulus Ve08.2h10 TaxID=930991 RepID=A0A0D0DMP5_9AGAM|nr:hypothetical protein PAXRUDRAFT_832060 [Paxillus rubicundulus Ve08.2h10]